MRSMMGEMRGRWALDEILRPWSLTYPKLRLGPFPLPQAGEDTQNHVPRSASLRIMAGLRLRNASECTMVMPSQMVMAAYIGGSSE